MNLDLTIGNGIEVTRNDGRRFHGIIDGVRTGMARGTLVRIVTEGPIEAYRDGSSGRWVERTSPVFKTVYLEECNYSATWTTDQVAVYGDG